MISFQFHFHSISSLIEEVVVENVVEERENGIKEIGESCLRSTPPTFPPSFSYLSVSLPLASVSPGSGLVDGKERIHAYSPGWNHSVLTK